jgi:hypothetical protein
MTVEATLINLPTQLFFPSSYLPIFPSSLFTPWPPEAEKSSEGFFCEKRLLSGLSPFY